MKKCITDYDLNDKRVIIRVDFNVPMKDKVILDDNRIKESIKTIKYAIDHNAKVILLSHLGRIKEEKDLKSNSLEIVAIRLSELLFQPVKFINATRGIEVENAVKEMKDKDVILLQNTRYEDLNGNKESSNDPELGAYWASLGDLFINDAFATSHRSHASNVGIASHLPNGIGFLVKKEIEVIMPILEHPEHPFTIILGGAKVNDKIGVINNLVHKADHILIGGGMACTFLKAEGYNVGKSIVDDSSIDFAKEMLSKYKDEIVLPIDIITGLVINKNAITSQKYIELSKTVVWNGPMGVSEIEKFGMGTKAILKSLVGDRQVIILGGDTASAAINMGYKYKFTHISTGGGAALEMLAGDKLPGIEVINEREEI